MLPQRSVISSLTARRLFATRANHGDMAAGSNMMRVYAAQRGIIILEEKTLGTMRARVQAARRASDNAPFTLCVILSVGYAKVCAREEDAWRDAMPPARRTIQLERVALLCYRQQRRARMICYSAHADASTLMRRFPPHASAHPIPIRAYYAFAHTFATLIRVAACLPARLWRMLNVYSAAQ